MTAPRSLTTAELDALHRVQLWLLLDFDRVCTALGLHYHLAAGTLLGAVRHGGFIPWDDDVDVVMPRTDYQRLLALAPPLFHPDHFLQHRGSDPGFRAHHAKLRRHDSEFRLTATAHLDCHHGIFIDIFPFDAVMADRWWGRLHWRLGWLATMLTVGFDHPRGGRLSPDQPAWRRIAARLIHLAGRLLPRRWWVRAYEGWIDLPRRAGARHVACVVQAPQDMRRAWRLVRPAEALLRTIRLPFAGHLLPAPADPLVTLHRLYGDDLSPPPPEKRRSPHRPVSLILPPDRG